MWRCPTANCAAFSPDNTQVATGSAPYKVCVWSTTTGDCLKTLTGHTDAVVFVTFSTDGAQLASGSLDGSVRVWSVETGACLHTMQVNSSWVLSVAFSADGKKLASGSRDGTVCVWSTESGARLHTLQGHAREAWCLAFSPDGARLASGSWDGSVRVWSTASGECLNVLEPDRATFIKSVAFSGDGQELAACSSDQKVRVWSASSFAHCLEFDHPCPETVAFARDDTLLSGSNTTVCAWSTKTRECLGKCVGEVGENARFMAFSPDCSRFLTYQPLEQQTMNARHTPIPGN